MLNSQASNVRPPKRRAGLVGSAFIASLDRGAADPDPKRAAIHKAIINAFERKRFARTPDVFEEADASLTKLCLQLVDIAAKPQGRVPSVEA